MQLTNDIYMSILNSPDCPPETGGILGGKHGVVTHIAIDMGLGDYDRYTPDTSHLNSIIAKWAEQGISLLGIYHTHFDGGIQLSNGDIRYISEIMDRTDNGIALYFPIVLPGKSIIAYRAEKNGELSIISDKVEIIKGGETNE